jgi:thioredoxin reductase (NADPH)
MVSTTLIENYPGFPEGISGSELGSLMHQQANRYGLNIATAEVASITQGQLYNISTTDGDFETASVIIAAGAENRKLEVPDEERLLGHGISYCATCDGFFFRGQRVAVVGGGNTAVTDALELTRYAKKVYVIHRRDQLRAGQILQQRAFAEPKLEFIWNTVINEVIGEKALTGLRLLNMKTHESSILEIAGVFVAIGVTPNSQLFSNIVRLDDVGSVVTNEMMATSAPGIFAAGDIRKNSVRQIAAAVGDGAVAAMSVSKYLQEKD